MASRNPSRPLPAVKNQFRPVSDWIGHINDVNPCPHDKEHVMKAHRLMRHIPKCTKINQALEKCPFDSMHHYPISQRDDHFKECKARAADIMSRIESGESLNGIEERYKEKMDNLSEC